MRRRFILPALTALTVLLPGHALAAGEALLDLEEMGKSLAVYGPVVGRAYGRDAGRIAAQGFATAIGEEGLRAALAERLARFGTRDRLADLDGGLFAVVQREERSADATAIGRPLDSFILLGQSFDQEIDGTGAGLASEMWNFYRVNLAVAERELAAIASALDTAASLPETAGRKRFRQFLICRAPALAARQAESTAFLAETEAVLRLVEDGLYGFDARDAAGLGVLLHPPILAALGTARQRALARDDRGRTAAIEAAMAEVGGQGLALGQDGPFLTRPGVAMPDSGLYHQLARATRVQRMLTDDDALHRRWGVDERDLAQAAEVAGGLADSLVEPIRRLRDAARARLRGPDGKPRLMLTAAGAAPAARFFVAEASVDYRPWMFARRDLRAAVAAQEKEFARLLAIFEGERAGLEEAQLLAVRASQAVLATVEERDRALVALQLTDAERAPGPADEPELAALLAGSDARPDQRARWLAERRSLAANLARQEELGRQIRGEVPAAADVLSLDRRLGELRQQEGDHRLAIGQLEPVLGVTVLRPRLEAAATRAAERLPRLEQEAVDAERERVIEEGRLAVTEGDLAGVARLLGRACDALEPLEAAGPPVIERLRLKDSQGVLFSARRHPVEELGQAAAEARSALCELEQRAAEAFDRYRRAQDVALGAGVILYRAVWASAVLQLGIETADFLYETMSSKGGPLYGAFNAAVAKATETWIGGDPLIEDAMGPRGPHWTQRIELVGPAVKDALGGATGDMAEDPRGAIRILRRLVARAHDAVLDPVALDDIVSDLKTTLRSQSFQSGVVDAARDAGKAVTIDALKKAVAEITEGNALQGYLEADLDVRRTHLFVIYTLQAENIARDAYAALARRLERAHPRAEMLEDTEQQRCFAPGTPLRVIVGEPHAAARTMQIELGGETAVRSPDADEASNEAAWALTPQRLQAGPLGGVTLRAIVER
ncbi:hypothetical protein SH611_11680 [Geminicoccaceae bacterium 1502E]|nr:hypothetical protein [Geminicoccaceae bacterium 1502E]